jgi:hypothetical protein
MSSPWGKFLLPITVPAAGWNFVYNDGGAQTATIAAGDYDTVLNLLEELHDKIEAESGGGTTTIAVTEVGIVSITIQGFVSVTWGSVNDDLVTLLGADESETVSGTTITMNGRHTHGWYPGVISFSTSNTDTSHGAGVVSDSGWEVAGDMIRTYAGTGAARLVSPARRLYTRLLRFGPIKREEVFETRNHMVADFDDQWDNLIVYWYPDRSDGQVETPGTQMDPGYDNWEIDSDHEYYKVSLGRPVRKQQTTGNPDWFDVILDLRPEPK